MDQSIDIRVTEEAPDGFRVSIANVPGMYWGIVTLFPTSGAALRVATAIAAEVPTRNLRVMTEIRPEGVTT